MTSETSDRIPTLLERIREIITDSIRFWEPCRLLYNLLLGVIVTARFIVAWPHAKTTLSFDLFLFVFVLAVLANVCYTAAYLIDVFVQLSAFRAQRRIWRWIVFGVGSTFAGVLTYFFTAGFFGS